MNSPHLIFIITDQQRYDTIGALGYPHMRTPNLDRLVREGVSFDRCFCAAPSCAPSRASLFNAAYPHSVGVLRNGHPWGTSWAEQLREAGYHTINIGKMHTEPFDARCGFDQRFIVENKDRPLWVHARGYFFDEWQRFLFQSGVRPPTREWYRAEYPEYATALGAYEWPLEERFHPDRFVGGLACWFIREWPSNEPLFLQIGFPGPHPPYDPPRRYVELYNGVEMPLPELSDEEIALQPPPQKSYREEMFRGNHDAVKWLPHPTLEQLLRLRRFYAANVTLIDEQIGRILAALDERGFLENAIVVFTSDHGDCLGDHGHIQKWTMYDEILRVPALVWAPGRLPAGRRVDGLAQQFDLAPMLFELAGLEPPSSRVARSATALLDSRDGRDAVFAEHGPDALLKDVVHVSMIRTEAWKLVHYADQPWGELYDLTNDPQERRNLWDDPAYRDVRLELTERLLDEFAHSASEK